MEWECNVQWEIENIERFRRDLIKMFWNIFITVLDQRTLLWCTFSFCFLCNRTCFLSFFSHGSKSLAPNLSTTLHYRGDAQFVIDELNDLVLQTGTNCSGSSWIFSGTSILEEMRENFVENLLVPSVNCGVHIK